MEYDIVSERINKELTYYFGITYKQFEKLTFDDQEKLLNSIKRIKKKECRVFVGGGDEPIIIKKKKGQKLQTLDGIYTVGETLDDRRKRLDRKIKGITSPVRRFVRELIRKS